MGIVSDNDFDDELNRCNNGQKNNGVSNESEKAEIVEIERGRGKGNTEIPDSLRKVIGEESAINGRASALELARNFDVSPSSVSAQAVGAMSTASYDNRPNQSHIIKSKERIATRARSKLTQALINLTSEKLKDAKARDLSGIAKDMSAVIRNMEPETPRNPDERRGPTFIFYSPQFKQEEHFETIHVKE